MKPEINRVCMRNADTRNYYTLNNILNNQIRRNCMRYTRRLCAYSAV